MVGTAATLANYLHPSRQQLRHLNKTDQQLASSILLDRTLQRRLARPVRKTVHVMETRTQTEYPRRCMLTGTIEKMERMFEVTIEAHREAILQDHAGSQAQVSLFPESQFS